MAAHPPTLVDPPVPRSDAEQAVGAEARHALRAWVDLQRPPHEESRRSRLAARVGGLVALAGLLAYLAWRTFATLPDSGAPRVLGIVLLVTEALPLVPLVGRILTLWTLDSPRPPRAGPDEEYGPVVVLIPTYNEPVGILGPTVAAACAIQPAHETWVLDDGDRPWVADLCRSYGARYVQRETHDHAKAGNLNHALRLLREEDNPAEFVAVLDCDHVPLAGFLWEMLGWFDDPRIALVQAPQAYYNHDAFDSDGFAGDQGVFFHVQMVARDHRRSDPFWCGSTSILRRSALEEAGGVAQETITEDLHTTLKLLQRGWRTVYHHQILALGLAPDTPEHYMRQRRRWALGNMQVLVLERLWWPKRWLTWRNYHEYLVSVSWWFEGMATVLALFLPAAVMLSGVRVSTAPPVLYVGLFLGQLALQMWGTGRLYRGFIRWRHTFELRVFRIPIGVACVWWVLTRKELAFDVTPKTGRSEIVRGRVPGLITGLAAAIAAILVYGVATLVTPLPWPSSPTASLIGGVWLFWGEVQLLMGIARIRAPQYGYSRRATPRITADARALVDGRPAELADIASTGLAVTFADGAPPPTGDTAEILLPGVGAVTLRRIHTDGRRSTYGMRTGDYDALRILSTWMFHTPDHDDHGLPPGVPAVALVDEVPAYARVLGSRTPGGTGHRRRTDIQGLRAVAVGLVLLSHLGVRGFAGGFLGVDIFFVISGFLITSLLLREYATTGIVSFRDFYARRALRILPAAIVAGAGILLWAGLTQSPVRIRTIAVDGGWAAAFMENFRLIHQATDYFADQSASPFQHFWSLAVEEQFYLAWPLLFLLFRGAFTRRVFVYVTLAAITLSVVVSLYRTHNEPSEAYFSTDVRVHELGIGVALAVLLWHGARLRSWVTDAAGLLGLGLLVVSVAFVRETGFPGWHALPPTLGVALIIAAGLDRQRGINRLLGLAPLRWLGDVSFSLYLWHWPIILFGRSELPASWPPVARDAVLIAASLLAAQLSYSLIEQPLLRMRRRSLRGVRPLLLWPVAAVTTTAIAFAAIGVATWHFQHASRDAVAWYAAHDRGCSTTSAGSAAADTTPAVAAIQAELACSQQLADAGAPVPHGFSPTALSRDTWESSGCWVLTRPVEQTCLDPPGARLTIATLGDSHMGQWMPALARLSAKYDARVVPFVYAGCPPIDLPFDSGSGGPVPQWCQDDRSYARATLAQLHPDVLIVSSILDLRMATSTDPTGQQWRQAATSAMATFSGLADHVVWLGDSPLRQASVPDCLGQPGAEIASCAMQVDPMQSGEDSFMARLAAQDGVTYLDTQPLLCAGSYCPAIVGSRGLYSDNSHVAAGWSRHVAAALTSMLAPTIEQATRG